MNDLILQNKKREDLFFIKSNFDNISQREIARKLNMGKTTINRWSKEMGLKHKKHIVNEAFFDEFNEESSYILGLILADGNINWNPKKSYRALTITACEKDKIHLEKIRKLLSSTKPLLYSPKTKSYRMIVNSKKICQRLMQLGITPKKSLIIKFPDVPKEYIKHFIRGAIDGDGNIRYVKRKRSSYFEITIASGSKEFCEGLINSIKENLNVDANIRKTQNNTYIIQYSCSRGIKLAKFIYSDATIFLKRKYLPYKENIISKNE